MIKNKGALLKGRLAAKRKQALQIIEAGLAAVQVKGAVEKAKLPALGKFENIYVVGFGKASAAMAESLERRLGRKIVKGAVVSVRKARTSRITGFKGTHPIPSAANVKAAHRILKICEQVGKNDLVIALVSGGGSALLALPAKGISLQALQRTNKLLVNSKVGIDEINIVRKHLSAVKGGQLMEAVYPAKLHALIVSDVIGDDLSVIASGPTVGDKSNFKGAVNVLKKHGLWKKAPAAVRKRLSLGSRGEIAETPKPGNSIFRKASNKIILNNEVALMAMQRKAKAVGFNAKIYSSELDGEASHAGRFLVKKAMVLRQKSGKQIALIAGGETTVSVQGMGKGGRNQEMILGALAELAIAKKAVFASVGSDGIDGNSRAAGALADSNTLAKAAKLKLGPGKFLQRNDSNGFFRKIKGEVLTGYTETNVMDLQLVLI